MIAPLPDLPVQLVGILTPGAPSLAEIGLVRGQDARTWATRGSLRETVRSDEAADRVASHAELPSDRSDPHPSFKEPHDLLIPGMAMTASLLLLSLGSSRWSDALVLVGLAVQVSRRR